MLIVRGIPVTPEQVEDLSVEQSTRMSLEVLGDVFQVLADIRECQEIHTFGQPINDNPDSSYRRAKR